MRLLSLKDVNVTVADREFKESSVAPLAAALITFTLATLTALVAFHVIVWPVPIPEWHVPRGMLFYVSGVLYAITAIPLVTLVKTRHPDNWLVRVKGPDTWIKFRSFRNRHMPRDEVQVIELKRREIAWVRPTKIRQTTDTALGAERSRRVEAILYLDIGLAVPDAGALRSQLEREFNRPPSGGRIVRSKSRDYPVRLLADGTLRVRWRSSLSRITPPIDLALKHFETWTEVRPGTHGRDQYTLAALRELGAAEQRAKLRELNVTHPLEATHLARVLFGLSTADAKRLLESPDEAGANERR